MRTHVKTLEHANAMSAPTWHFLKMNDTSIEIPEELAIIPNTTCILPQHARGAAGAFEDALADAQSAWEKSHPELTEAEKAEREEFLAAEADATYGGIALSDYQTNAEALEEARSLSLAFEQGTGRETASYLRCAAGDPIVVYARPDTTVDAELAVQAAPGIVSVAAIDVVAGANATVNLSISVDGRGCESPDAAQAPHGVTGTTLRVFAGADARVSVARTQTLDHAYTDIDDMGLFADDRAHIRVHQTVLGAGKTFTGLAGDLRGDSSEIEVDTRYLGFASQVHDFNYALRHHGAQSKCDLNANGVLAGTSSKTLRGTIDLIRGAKGAQGSEKETVLLVDEGVHNKTVPVILCSEDDVAGNHGATIGHIRDEQLFYLASRGLSQEAAERMFVLAAVEQAALDAQSDAARSGVLHLGERIAPGFSCLVEGDD